LFQRGSDNDAHTWLLYTSIDNNDDKAEYLR
jgi:hypothetical protein